MSIFPVSAQDGVLRASDAPDTEPRLPLANALSQTAPGTPVMILVHGYSHHPHLAKADPSRHIYATHTRRAGAPSWPLALGYGPTASGDGLCIPFAWPGRVDAAATLLQRLNRFSTIYARAHDTARDLARLITWITEIAPDRPVLLLAHSLGARCVLTALRHLPADSVARVVLLGAAAFASETTQTLKTAPAAKTARFFNIIARQNDLYDLAFEWLAPRSTWTDRALGRGLTHPPGNWLDIQLDHPDIRATLARHGIGLATTAPTISHTEFYLRPGAMQFYRHLLCKADNTAIADLRRDLDQITPQPMGTRLLRALSSGWPSSAPLSKVQH